MYIWGTKLFGFCKIIFQEKQKKKSKIFKVCYSRKSTGISKLRIFGSMKKNQFDDILNGFPKVSDELTNENI